MDVSELEGVGCLQALEKEQCAKGVFLPNKKNICIVSFSRHISSTQTQGGCVGINTYTPKVKQVFLFTTCVQILLDFDAATLSTESQQLQEKSNTQILIVMCIGAGSASLELHTATGVFPKTYSTLGSRLKIDSDVQQSSQDSRG